MLHEVSISCCCCRRRTRECGVSGKVKKRRAQQTLIIHTQVWQHCKLQTLLQSILISILVRVQSIFNNYIIDINHKSLVGIQCVLNRYLIIHLSIDSYKLHIIIIILLSLSIFHTAFASRAAQPARVQVILKGKHINSNNTAAAAPTITATTTTGSTLSGWLCRCSFQSCRVLCAVDGRRKITRLCGALATCVLLLLDLLPLLAVRSDDFKLKSQNQQHFSWLRHKKKSARATITTTTTISASRQAAATPTATCVENSKERRRQKRRNNNNNNDKKLKRA